MQQMAQSSAMAGTPTAMSYSMLGNSTQITQQQYQQALYQQRQLQQSMNASSMSVSAAPTAKPQQQYASQTTRPMSIPQQKPASATQAKQMTTKPVPRPTFNPQQPIIQYNIPPSYTQNLQNSGILPSDDSEQISRNNNFNAPNIRSSNTADAKKSQPTPAPTQGSGSSTSTPVMTQVIGNVPQLTTAEVQKRLDESGELLKEWESMLNKSGNYL